MVFLRSNWKLAYEKLIILYLIFMVYMEAKSNSSDCKSLRQLYTLVSFDISNLKNHLTFHRLQFDTQAHKRYTIGFILRT